MKKAVVGVALAAACACGAKETILVAANLPPADPLENETKEKIHE